MNADWCKPTSNAAPSQRLPIITNDDPRSIVPGHWGFKPKWAQSKKNVRELINARGETIAEKPFFRSAFQRRRCLVLATGFYEWQQAAPRKIPYRFRLCDQEPFAFAGIFETFTDEDRTERPHYAIVTTNANDVLASIHSRMPLILQRKNEPAWLDPELSPSGARELIAPYPAELMEGYRVSPLVNSPKNDTPDLIIPERN